MDHETQGGPLPGASTGPNVPSGAGPDHIDTSGGRDAGEPGYGSGGVRPIPNPSGIPGKPRSGEGEDKGDLAPGADQALKDIGKGSR
jgi:hypothetical protein